MSSPIVIQGQLVDDASGQTTRDGIARLTLQVAAGTGALDADTLVVLASMAYGTGHAAAAARDARVRQLRRGVRVVIEGRGCIRGRRLVLVADAIRTPDVFDPRLLAAGNT